MSNINNLISKVLTSNDNTAFKEIIEYVRPTLNNLTSFFFVSGYTKEDLRQELLILLRYYIIPNYKKCSNADFKTYFFSCARNKLITMLHTSDNNKYKTLNSAISLGPRIKEDENYIIPKIKTTPVDILINMEELDNYNNLIMPILSNLELKVFYLFCEGYTYEEISENINKPVKTVDNALTRIKQKCKELLELKSFRMKKPYKNDEKQIDMARFLWHKENKSK